VAHWLKNALVFAAPVFSGNAASPGPLLNAVLGFTAFSALASVVYIVNDIKDREKDRLHKTKQNRPLASGVVSVRGGVLLAGVITGVLIFLLTLLVRQNPNTNFLPAACILLLYAVLNLGYSFGLKNFPIIDITILAAGYVLRVVFGAAIIGVEVSVWLYLTVTLAAFYMGLGKRRNEIDKQKGTRAVMRFYTRAFLDKNMYVCQGLCVVFYTLWSFDSATVERFHTNAFVYTIPLVFIILLKYSLDIEGETDGDPVTVLLRDKVLLLLCTAYIAAAVFIIFFAGKEAA